MYWASEFQHGTIFGRDTLADPKIIFLPFIARWQPCNQLILGKDEPGKETGDVTLFPNPSNGKFALQIANGHQLMANSQIEIYNMLGEKIYSNPLTTYHSPFTINITGQPSGVYLYRIITETGNLVGEGKFIIN